MVTFCQTKYDVFSAVEQEEDDRKGNEIFFNKMYNYGRRTDNNYNEYPQFPYQFMWPFLFVPFQEQPNGIPPMNTWQWNQNDRQVQFQNNEAGEGLDGTKRYQESKKHEKQPAKEPKP